MTVPPGCRSSKACRGATIVQDPQEALYAGMPASTLAHVAVDAVVPSTRIAETIAALVSGGGPPPVTDPGTNPGPTPPAGDEVATICPECGGC